MDIRTKLIFALVAVALASMFTFGSVMAPDVEQRLRRNRLIELDELAESKREALLWILEGWRDRTALVASRTQLRVSLEQHSRTGSQTAVDRMSTILSDALGSSETATLLQVLDLEGDIVASAMAGTEAPFHSRAISDSIVDNERSAYAGVEFVDTGPPQVRFTAPLSLNDRRIGTLVAVFGARELIELTGHYHGLGDTGEVLLIARDASGAPRTLHPTRHGGGTGVDVRLSGEPGGLAARAFAAGSEPSSEGVIDDRGEPVWTATRLVPETGWGLVVKIDHEEETQQYTEFRRSLLSTALILSAFAILAGFGLGLRFALPIHHLAEVANRIRGGEMSARATVTGEDEVGLLARTFNDMATELEEKMSLLHEFRRFFDVSVDLMCMGGTDGFFKRVNPAFERELGWSEEELLERPFFDFIHPDDVQRTEQEVAKLSQGIPTISFENRYECKDGSFKHLLWATYPDAETGMLYAVAHVIEAPAAEKANTVDRGDGTRDAS